MSDSAYHLNLENAEAFRQATSSTQPPVLRVTVSGTRNVGKTTAIGMIHETLRMARAAGQFTGAVLEFEETYDGHPWTKKAVDSYVADRLASQAAEYAAKIEALQREIDAGTQVIQHQAADIALLRDSLVESAIMVGELREHRRNEEFGK